MTAEEELAALEELQKLEAEKAEATIGRDRRNAAVSGITEGLVGSTVGLPGDVNSLLERVPGYKQLPWLLKGPGALMPTTQDITRAAKDVTGLPFHYDPETPSGKYTKAVTGGVAGNMLPMGKIPWLLRAVAGAAGGASGEAVQNATDSGVAGAGTNMLVNLVLQTLGSRSPQVVKALQGDLKSLGGTDAEISERLKAAAEKANNIEAQTGARPVLSQALDEKTSLSGVTQEVQASPAGRKIDLALEKQLSVGKDLVEDQVSRASRLPVDASTENRILRAGDKALKRPMEVARAAADRSYRAGKRDKLPVADEELFRKRNTESSKDIYDQSGEWQGVETQTATGREKVGNVYDATPVEGNPKEWKVQKVTADELVKRLYARAEELSLDGGNKAAKPFREAAQNILNLADKYPDGIPFGHLDVIQRQAATAAELASQPGQKVKTVLRKEANQSIAGIINDVLKEGSPALAKGKEIYSTAAQGYLKQVEESALPGMFPNAARQSGRGDYTVMGQIITDPRYGPKDIAFAAHNLRRADPEAFPAIVKQVWGERWEQATKNAEGRTPQQVLNSWTNHVTGPSGSELRKNYLETVKQVHLSRGAAEEEAAAIARGANAVADALETFSRDRRGVGAINSTEMRMAAGRNVVSSVARSASTHPTWPAARAFERVLWRRTYEQIADALTSPEGAQKLIEIANFSLPKRAAEAFLRSMVLAENQGTNFYPDETRE